MFSLVVCGGFLCVFCVCVCLFVSYLRNRGEKSYSSIFSFTPGLEVVNPLRTDLRRGYEIAPHRFPATTPPLPRPPAPSSLSCSAGLLARFRIHHTLSDLLQC